MLSIIISSYKTMILSQLKRNILETIGIIDYEIISINNPGIMSICEAYNEGAKKAKFENLLFIHEDVKFHTNNWYKLLTKYYSLKDLGVFGLAGNKRKFHLPYGFHSGLNNEGFMFLNHTAHEKIIFQKQDFPFKVKVIDGVFIGMKKSVWQKNKFNQSLKGFHFYDLDISLRTSVDYQNYLVTDLDFEHFSEGNFGDQWIKACISFNKSQSYNYNLIKPKEKRDIRKFWYQRLLNEDITFINRLRYVFAMGTNKDTLKECIKFIFKIYD